MTITLPILPPTTSAQQKGVAVNASGKPVFYTKTKVKREGEALAWWLAPHRPPAPIDRAVRLEIIYTYPYLQSVKKRHLGQYIPKATRPDVDNVAKLHIDTLVRMQFLRDDALVADLHLVKRFGPTASVQITIDPLDV